MYYLSTRQQQWLRNSRRSDLPQTERSVADGNERRKRKPCRKGKDMQAHDLHSYISVSKELTSAPIKVLSLDGWHCWFNGILPVILASFGSCGFPNLAAFLFPCHIVWFDSNRSNQNKGSMVDESNVCWIVSWFVGKSGFGDDDWLWDL